MALCGLRAGLARFIVPLTVVPWGARFISERGSGEVTRQTKQKLVYVIVGVVAGSFLPDTLNPFAMIKRAIGKGAA